MSFKLKSFYIYICCFTTTHIMQTELQPILSQSLLPWQTDCSSKHIKLTIHHWIVCPWEPPVRRKHLGDISYTRRVIGDFVLNFVAMATGMVTVEFVCHSIAGTRSPRTNCKNLGDICYKCKNTYQSKTHCKDDAMKSLH